MQLINLIRRVRLFCILTNLNEYGLENEAQNLKIENMHIKRFTWADENIMQVLYILRRNKQTLEYMKLAQRKCNDFYLERRKKILKLLQTILYTV